MSASVDLARAPHLECDVAPLRAAFLASGKTAAQVGLAVGWTRHGDDRRGDGTRVLRRLGLMASWSRGRKRFQERCSYETAVALAAGIGVDPREVDL